jgi:hypothetical protein
MASFGVSVFSALSAFQRFSVIDFSAFQCSRPSKQLLKITRVAMGQNMKPSYVIRTHWKKLGTKL